MSGAHQQQGTLTPNRTIEGVWRVAVAQLRQANIPQPMLDARILICHALGVPDTLLLAEPSRAVTNSEWAVVDALLRRRMQREPVAKIIGYKEFWSLDFEVGPHTLDPRPDSETLVEIALRTEPATHSAPYVLDLGTGTGCLLLSVLDAWPNARGIGVDIDSSALSVARNNAVRLGLAGRTSFVRANWAAPIAAKFNLVLINPPYIETRKIPTLEPEVAQYEAQSALDGGADGLAAYRDIAEKLAPLLEDDGRAIIEIGDDQQTEVCSILTDAGLHVVGVEKDLAGVSRCVTATK